MRSQSEAGSGVGEPTLAVSSQTLLVLIAGDVAFGIMMALFLPSPVDHGDVWIVAKRLSALGAQVAAIAFAVSHGVRVFGAMEPPRRDVGFGIAKATMSCFLFAFATSILLGLVGFDAGGGLEAVSLAARVTDYVSVVLLTPLLEEAIFRSILLRSLMHRAAHPAAVVAASLLFGAFHLSVVGASSAVVLGLVLGTLFVRTRSIWACVAGHSAWNLTKVTLASADGLRGESVTGHVAGFAPLLISAALALGLLCLAWPQPRHEARRP